MSRKPKPLLPLLNELKANLKYDPETGYFYWIHFRHKIAPGQRAECLGSSGRYYKIFWKGSLYAAHRVAWLLMTETEPPEELDHENLDGLNNEWSNIREATRSQNCMNRAFSNPLGKGVTFHKASNKYAAQIALNKKKIHLGLFDNPEEAHEAYKQASAKLHGEYSRADLS